MCLLTPNQSQERRRSALYDYNGRERGISRKKEEREKQREKKQNERQGEECERKKDRRAVEREKRVLTTAQSDAERQKQTYDVTWIKELSVDKNREIRECESQRRNTENVRDRIDRQSM